MKITKAFIKTLPMMIGFVIAHAVLWAFSLADEGVFIGLCVGATGVNYYNEK